MASNNQRREVDLSGNPVRRTLETLGRGAIRRCPYCGGGQIFKGWFSLKDRCPHCHTLFAHEEGYFLGAYPLNLVFTSIIAVLVVIWMIVQTDLSVVQMQILAVVLVVGPPLFLYPYMLSLWMTIDLLVHPGLVDRERT
jgi:uncharacterized protein (DUF983 family)